MAIKILDSIEKYLARYRILVGVLVLIMLIVISALTYVNFDKQNQIIETGGFVDGNIKCVCSQEAWDEFMAKDDDVILSDIGFSDG